MSEAPSMEEGSRGGSDERTSSLCRLLDLLPIADKTGLAGAVDATDVVSSIVPCLDDFVELLCDVFLFTIVLLPDEYTLLETEVAIEVWCVLARLGARLVEWPVD